MAGGVVVPVAEAMDKEAVVVPVATPKVAMVDGWHSHLRI